MPELQLTEEETIRVAMRLLGQRTSERKAKSSRENALIGSKRYAEIRKKAKINKTKSVASP